MQLVLFMPDIEDIRLRYRGIRQRAMKRGQDLLHCSIYHPSVALPAIYLTDVLRGADSGLASALVVSASGLTFQLVRLLGRWHRRRISVFR